LIDRPGFISPFLKGCNMKKLILGITAIIISLVFFSCPNDPGNDDPVVPNNPGQKTLIVFDNTYGICTVLVYNDYRRREMDNIAVIPAGQCSDEIEQRPSTSTPFYFAYRISLKGVSGFFVDFVPAIGKDQKAVRIDAGTRTVVPIPVLDDAVSSQEQVLSNKSYLSVQNNSAYSFQLHRGISMIRPDNSPDSGVVNSNERAPYTINPGRSSDFRLLVGADYEPFPASPERFEAGNFYRYQYNNSVSLDTYIPINLDNVDIKTYTVSFDNNGGSGAVPAAQTVRVAYGITLPSGSGLSKGDEIFGGWCADESGSGVVYSAGTIYTVTGDITLYAKWYPAGTTLYTVTFDSDGGNTTASQSMVSGAIAVRPADPYRAGYTFTGWYRELGAQSPYDFTRPVTESFTLSARWIANRYTVTFNANGAGGTVPAAVTVDYGSSITLPEVGGLSKPDETFRNWNTEDDGRGTAYLSGVQYTVTADVTLFAVWSNIPVYEMVFVPDGSFEMGRNLGTGGGSDVTPVHTVTLGGYYMGIYEVTQAQYEAVMWTTIEEQQALAGTNTTNYGRGDNYPMYYVNWYDALVFCNKLSMAEGLSPAYIINNSTDPAIWGSVPSSNNAAWNAVQIISGSTGYRLPTEAQWEYAAKGGNGSPGNYTYAGSNNLDDVAWYSGNSSPTTHTIGTKAPNGLGIYDMSGNVSEWCWDWIGSYSSEAQNNPDGASSGSDRIVRGGSWYFFDQYASSIYRYNSYQYIRNNSLGFRPVRPAAYSITFNINGGTGTAPAAQIASLGTITLPNGSGFSRTGYLFDGWNTNADGTGTDYSAGSSYTVTGNAALYAKWVYPTITFDINGGSGTAPAFQTARSGSTITLPDSTGFSKSGYILGGWNTNADGTGINYSAGSSYTVTGNATLYAKWVELYTITFNLNGGTGTTPTSQTAGSGSTITLPGGGGLSKSGYIFGGWNTNADGTGETYSAGSSYTVTGNTTLYVKWVELYTITFNLNGGTGTTPASQTAGSGLTITLPGGEGLSKSGYIFGGWNTNTGGTGETYSAGSSYTVTGNTTLYVKWDTAYTVTFNINGGTGTTPAAQTVSPGSTITLPGEGGFSRNGYSFDVWNTDPSGTGTNYSAGSSYTVTGNITLYAKWNDNIGTITSPIWIEGNAVSLASPAVILPVGQTITAQGWQISDTGNGNWANFTLPATAAMSLDRKYLRYYTVSSSGSTFYSNVVIIFVFDANNMNNMMVTNTDEWNSARNTIRNGSNNQTYTVYISGDIGVAGNTANTFGTATGITITLTGSGKLYLTGRGRIITLADDQTLIIDSAGLTLQGLTSDQNGATQDNNTAVVYLEGSNAQLELRNGTISGNTNSSYYGGGGGVVVGNGSFTMNGGGTSGNTSSPSSQSHGGGGVYVAANATFTMNSGEISGNTNSSRDGGGVYVAGNGTFTMNGGAISSNTTSYTNSCGGGVCVDSNGTFTMSNGTISGNTSSGAGGGVYVASNGTFTMSNGIISGNTSVGSYGGGVYTSGTFTMRGGEISSNTAYSGGGGVCAGSTVSIFHIVTGTVYGSDAYPTTLRNTGREGAALYGRYGTNQRGTFNGETWVSAGSLSTTDDTIRVVNGELQ
jgi:uncharacterized repeat protein (TIGR02543 family)